MREGGLRRGSPGYRSRSSSRSRSRSPWSRSRSPRSRSRSRSPYRRPGSRSPPGGYRSRSPVRRYSRSRSRSPSRSPPRQRGASPARSNSSDESGQVRDKSRSRSRRDRARVQPAPSPHQQQAVGRPGQDSEQLRALRQQLEQEQLARAAAESKADLLRSKLREVAERSKARGNTLASVVSAVRRVADAKQQLSSAEADLQQALQDAEAFLQDESAAAPTPAQHAAPAPPEQDDHQQLQQYEHAAANGTDVRMQDSPEDDAGGGWVQASADNAAPARQQPPLSNIKFSLKL